MLLVSVFVWSRLFCSDLSLVEGSLEGICNVFIEKEEGFNVYIPFLTNMEQGLKILREYGGSFLLDYQRQLGDSMSLIGHLCSPRVRLVHYLEMFRDLTFCAQKQYLHGVSLVKVSVSMWLVSTLLRLLLAWLVQVSVCLIFLVSVWLMLLSTLSWLVLGSTLLGFRISSNMVL